MAKITRAVQKIFGSNAGFDQIAQFGSLAAAAPVFTTNPVTIQALSNYLVGWFNGVEATNSPAIEDMNALCYLYAYQLAYIMQAGTPEWDASTTYYKGSLVNDSNGVEYVSTADNNLNNALVNNPSFWQLAAMTAQTAPASVTVPAGQNYNTGFLIVPSGVQYTVAGSMCVGGVLQATGTGVVQGTGTGIVHGF